MKIIELRSENVKCLKAVHIRPDGNVIQITGKNGQGKSAVLDSIEFVLCGSSAKHEDLIRQGEKSLKGFLDLGDFKVTRQRKRGGRASLKVVAADGTEPGSPQTVLEKLYSKHAFDPLAFSRMDAKKQAETLRKITGLDFSEHDAERQKVFDQRTEVNRGVKRLEAQLAGMPEAEKIVTAVFEPVDVTALVDELAEAHEHNRRVDEIAQGLRNWEQEVSRIASEIEVLTAKLEHAKAERDLKRKQDAEMEPIDIVAIRRCLDDAEKTNESVRQHERRVAEHDRLQAAREDLIRKLRLETDAANVLTTGLHQLDEKKAEAIAKAKMPVPGISFDGDEITLNGIPFRQASSAEQLRTSVAMGLALNPELRVMLIREGSVLDSNSLAMIQQMAEEADAQVWLERVTDGEPVGIVIEDGSVRENEEDANG